MRADRSKFFPHITSRYCTRSPLLCFKCEALQAQPTFALNIGLLKGGGTQRSSGRIGLRRIRLPTKFPVLRNSALFSKKLDRLLSTTSNVRDTKDFMPTMTPYLHVLHPILNLNLAAMNSVGHESHWSLDSLILLSMISCVMEAM